MELQQPKWSDRLEGCEEGSWREIVGGRYESERTEGAGAEGGLMAGIFVGILLALLARSSQVLLVGA